MCNVLLPAVLHWRGLHPRVRLETVLEAVLDGHELVVEAAADDGRVVGRRGHRLPGHHQRERGGLHARGVRAGDVQHAHGVRVNLEIAFVK